MITELNFFAINFYLNYWIIETLNKGMSTGFK